MNKVTLLGRATSEFEQKIVWKDLAVLNFFLATNRRYKNQHWNLVEDVEYHKCVALWKVAELMWQYIFKWWRMYIEWRLKTKKREDAAWVMKYMTEVVVEQFIAIDKPEKENLSEKTEDDDLPF